MSDERTKANIGDFLKAACKAPLDTLKAFWILANGGLSKAGELPSDTEHCKEKEKCR